MKVKYDQLSIFQILLHKTTLLLHYLPSPNALAK